MAGRSLNLGFGAALAVLVAACAGHPPAPRGAAAATMTAGPLPSGPARPTRGLPIPSLDVPWAPPMLTAGDPAPVRRALRRHESLALHLGSRLDSDEQRARVQALAAMLHPGVAVVSSVPEVEPFAARVLPLSRVPDDETKRPRYRWADGPLPAASGASATLVIDDAEVDPAAWRALSARSVGSCQAPMEALAAGQEQSLAELEPFLDHADAVLWQVYRAALQATVPRLVAELSPYEAPRDRAEFEDDGSWERYECGHAYWEVLQSVARCGAEDTPCPSSPRVFLVGGARIGTVEPSVYVPEGCAARVGHDYVAELRSVAGEAAEVVSEHLDPAWSTLADRLGALTEVYDALEDVCVPRRRRFAAEDLAAARGRLASIGQALASEQLVRTGTGWTVAEQPFHVPGVGPVQQLAAYDPGEGSPSRVAVAQARALREFVLQRALCRQARPALPLAVAVVDGSGEVDAFGYFFEEELLCGTLPPLAE